MINVYAPTQEATEKKNIKHSFYDKLEETYEQSPKQDIIMIMDNFNAQVGQEEWLENVAWKNTLHKYTNNNKQMLCNLAAATNTRIISTKFRHKRLHKITWMQATKCKRWNTRYPKNMKKS